MKNEYPMLKYTCPKCGSRKCKVTEIRVAYNLFTQLFDIFTMLRPRLLRVYLTSLSDSEGQILAR